MRTLHAKKTQVVTDICLGCTPGWLGMLLGYSYYFSVDFFEMMISNSVYLLIYTSIYNTGS